MDREELTAIGSIICTSFNAIAWGGSLILLLANDILNLVLDAVHFDLGVVCRSSC